MNIANQFINVSFVISPGKTAITLPALEWVIAAPTQSLDTEMVGRINWPARRGKRRTSKPTLPSSF
jgi:hypothetical protein